MITNIALWIPILGWPGSVYDACVLAHSTFYKKANTGQLLSGATKSINGVNVPVFVIGDSAYLMLPWFMKPYNQPSVDSAEKRTHSTTTEHVEDVL